MYELCEEDEENNTPLIKENKSFEVPYRMIFAVASLDSVTLYDTQHAHPIGEYFALCVWYVGTFREFKNY